MKAHFYKKTFHFKKPSGTSRGVLTEKYAWFIEIWNVDQPQIIGIGECSIIPGLSPEFNSFEEYELKLKEVCSDLKTNLTLWPSILFGLETALLDLKSGGNQLYFNNGFSRGELKIDINGLVWMGDKEFMLEQIDAKIKAGFTTIKMKIGAIDFNTEIELLTYIRSQYSAKDLTLRVDANGAFEFEEAIEKLNILSSLDIHSIEQPIKAGNWSAMKELCKISSLDIALDEELIGVHSLSEKRELLNTIQPPFIILKPSLHGGISGCREWISLANEFNVKWWMTSALESNVGLKAICQFVAEYDTTLPQGLGTGALYTDNTESDLTVENGQIFTKLT